MNRYEREAAVTQSAHQSAAPAAASGKKLAPEPLDSYEYVEPAVLQMAGPLARGTRVLDIGCGGGYFAGRLTELGCTAVGVDPHPWRIDVARTRHPGIRFAQLEARPDLIDLLDDEPFDLVVSTEVLEHLYAPETLAQGAFNALRPGGRLILSTPYHGYLKNLALALAGRTDAHHQPLQTGGHIKFFNRSAAARLLRSAGFDEIRFAGAGRIPALWKSMIVGATRPA